MKLSFVFPVDVIYVPLLSSKTVSAMLFYKCRIVTVGLRFSVKVASIKNSRKISQR